MDHGKGSAPPGDEPNIQVHLIPSCGVNIANPCVVKDGLVFNVDKGHQAAQDAVGGHIDKIDDTPFAVGPATSDYFPPSGVILVYDPAAKPKETRM